MKSRIIPLFLLCATAALMLVGCNSGGSGTGTADKTNDGGKSQAPGEKIKVGFIVKQMDDAWFQSETKFAKETADKLGVELLVQEAKNGEAVISTIDNMANQGAKGIIICSPEVKLGTAIKNACDAKQIKLMSVDDRLVDTSGQPIKEIPHLGISATNIGKLVGQAIADEMKNRKWNPDEVGAIVILKEGLETAQQRVDGAKEVLLANGFKSDKIFIAPWMGANDIPAASDAANAIITREAGIKKWVVYSSNDDGVIGAVRSLENSGLSAESIIGVGINGMTAAQDFRKDKPTGVFASVLLSPRTHGSKTVEMMAAWIRDNKMPEMETYTAGTVINRQNYVEEMKKEGVE